MSGRRGAWLSPAAAAGEAGLPVWAIWAFVRKGALHVTPINGLPRINKRELETFLALHRPESAVAA